MFNGKTIKKTIAPALFAGVVLFTALSCEKNVNNSAKQLEIDKEKIEGFISTYSLSPSADLVPSQTAPQGSIPLADTAKVLGNMYIIHLRQGAGDKPTIKDRVLIRYRGYYMEGLTVFDSTEDDPAPYAVWLSGAIQGMREGLSNMKTAVIGENGDYVSPGEAWLIIPSTMAFGANGKTDPTVPPNTCLVYRVTLYTINGQTD